MKSFLIYHNASLRALLRRAARNFTVWAIKSHVLPPGNASESRQGVLRAWIVMHRTACLGISAWIQARRLKTRTKPDWKRWTGAQFIAWPWGVAGAAGKPVFSISRNRVRRQPAMTLWQVAGRLTTRITGDSNRELIHDSPWIKNTQNDELNLESIHHNNMIIKRESYMNRKQFVDDSL